MVIHLSPVVSPQRVGNAEIISIPWRHEICLAGFVQNFLRMTQKNKNYHDANIFSFKKMNLKMSSGKCWPFCLCLNVLTLSYNSSFNATQRHSGHYDYAQRHHQKQKLAIICPACDVFIQAFRGWFLIFHYFRYYWHSSVVIYMGISTVKIESRHNAKIMLLYGDTSGCHYGNLVAVKLPFRHLSGQSV